MKSFTRFLLLTIAFLGSAIGLNAQVSLYSYTESVEPYVPITGGTVVTSTTSSTLDDAPITGIALPFTMTYNGLPQSVVSINPNGFIYFGSAANYSYTPVSSVVNSIGAYARDLYGRQFVTASMTSGNPVITVTAGSTGGMQVGDAVFGTGIPAGATIVAVTATTVTMSAPASSTGSGRNFRAANGSIRYQTIGSAPNRKFIVQWTNFSRYSTTAPSDRLNFQIILEETTNIIRTSYNVTYVNVDHTIQAGLAGATNADFNHRTGNFNTTILAPANSSTVNSQASAFPTIGRTFTWTPPPFPTIAFSSITPNITSCTTSDPHQVAVDASIVSGTLSLVLNYSFNGVAQAPITMTNTSGTTYTATIPSASPLNATVTWSVLATSSYTTTASYIGTPYQDQTLLGVSAIANNSLSPVCSGSASSLSISFTSLQASALYNTPSVGAPTTDEDFGSVVITEGATTILSNTTAGGSLVGTIGTASGTPGSFSNFTAFGPYAMTAGSTYNFSLGSITQGGNYGNSMAIFIDYNRDGDFADAGEAAYLPTTTVSGPHVETGSFTIPTTALNGQTRMRVVCLELQITGIGSLSSWGEYEDYMLNISSPNIGGGLAPAITSAAWSNSTATALGTGNPFVINPTTDDSYSALVTAAGCTVNSSATAVNILALPTSPIATNSTQCGTQVPTASVASAAGTDGTGMFYWYDAATSGNLLQNPPLESTWTTFFTEDFSGATVATGATTNGSANLTNIPGWLELTAAANGLQGGITVNPGVNAQAYKVEFDVQTTTGGADGFSWSFAPDANATATSPAAEIGTGTKVKISFDAYGAMPNGAGTYLLYNNTTTSFNATSAGVLAFNAATPWLGAASAHVTITINGSGQLSLNVDGTDLFTNVALPAAYLNENKATWKHVVSARTGGLNMLTAIDNLSVQYKNFAAGSTTYGTPLASNTTLYVSELGVNGCLSTPSPVTVAVSQPAPVVYANSASTICIGESVTLNMSSTITPAYSYTVSSPNAGSGITTPVTGATHTFVPTASGSIPYIITAANGNCTEVDTLTFSVVPNASPAPIIAMDTITICPSATSAAFTATASSMNVAYTFNLIDSWGDGWNGNALKVLYNGVLAQTLTFTTGTNFSTTINVPEGTAVTTEWTIGSYLSECSFNIVVGGSTVHTAVMTTEPNIASQMYSGSVPAYNYTFNWYSAATGGTLLGTGATLETIGTSVLPNLNTAGQYTVYAVQSNACLSAATPAIVNVTNVLAQIVPIDASCNSVANGSFTLGTITCGTTPFSYSVDGGAFGAIPTNLAYGSHTVVVKDATGATAPVVSIFVNQPTWITNVPNFVANGWACKDATSEVISAANPNLQISATIPLGNVSIGGFGVATLSPALNLPIGAVITGATLQLTGMTTAGGTWASDLTVVASGLGTTNQVPSGLTVTNANYSYPLTAINPNGTSISVVVTNTYGFGTAIINNVSLVVSYTINQTLDNITWYAAPTGGTSIGSGFTLESVGTPVLPNTITPGTYNFYAQGELDGCSSFTRLLVPVTIQAPTVVANMQTATVCPGQFLTLNATGGLTYTWSNGAGQNTPFVPAPTAYVGGTQSYVVNGFDIDGCANQDTVVVTVLPQPILNAGVDQAVCAGIPVILNAGTTLQTATPVTGIVWSNAIPNNTQYVPTTSGILTATATGANGCTTQDAVQITVLALPVVNAGQDVTVCAGLSTTLNASGASSYAWNNGVSQGQPFYPNASQTYTVVGTGSNGCTNTDQLIVTVSTGPTVNLSAPQIVCANTPATLSAAVQNSLGGFWTTSNGTGVITPNVTNGTVNYTPNVNDPSVVNLTYVATNACGSASQNTTVTVLPIPTVNAGADFAVCQGVSATLTATGTGFLTWTTPNVTNGIAFVPTATANYNVVATAANNCTNSDQVTVTVLALPDVDAGANQTICSGESVILNGEGAVSYQWTGGVANNVGFAPTATTTYSVTGTGVNGCQNTDQVTVVVNATPVATISVVNDVTLAAAPAGMNYQWVNCASGTDVPNGSTATFTAIMNGSYAVIVTSPEGCSDQSDCEVINAVGLDQISAIEISVQPNPTAGDLTINMPNSLKASAQVFDAQGKQVLTESNIENGAVLHLESMTTGVYMVRITADSTIQTFRVVKQ